MLFAYMVFTVLGFLIMQSLGEMICIWPVANPLVRFVRDFVDEELGTVVGWLYWYGNPTITRLTGVLG